jgi:hypothetical protein
MLNLSAAPTGSFYFNCQGPGAISGHYTSIEATLPYCPVGAQLGIIGQAPECWDGVHLDSTDHRSHVAYATYGGWGYLKCPSTHPYVIPTFTFGAWFTVDANRNTWALSSDHMDTRPEHKRGDTFHTDFWMAWDPAIHDIWENNCLNLLLSCSGNNLGNGSQLKQVWPLTFVANPHTVAVP